MPDINANPKDSELLQAERDLNIVLIEHSVAVGRQMKWGKNVPETREKKEPE